MGSRSDEVHLLTRGDVRELSGPPLPAACGHDRGTAGSPCWEQGSHRESNLLGLDLELSVSKVVGKQISVD